MRFDRYLNEFSRERYGKGITFVDIDETIFKTFAKVLVKKNGKVVRELTNTEYNSYKLKDGEEYDFHQFRSAKIFRETSIPIPKTFTRIRNMIAKIKEMDSGSKIIFLTARASFNDMDEFKKTFIQNGVNIDGKIVDVEMSGDEWKPGKTIDGVKKNVMLRYIKTGEFRRVRLIDDHKPNLKALKDIEKNLSKDIEDKVINKYNLDITTEKIPPISFYALWIDDKGDLHLI